MWPSFLPSCFYSFAFFQPYFLLLHLNIFLLPFFDSDFCVVLFHPVFFLCGYDTWCCLICFSCDSISVWCVPDPYVRWSHFFISSGTRYASGIVRIFKIVLFVCFFLLISSSSTPKLFRTCDDRLHRFVAMSSCVRTILGLPIIYTTYGPFSRVVYRVFFYPCNTCWYNIIKKKRQLWDTGFHWNSSVL